MRKGTERRGSGEIEEGMEGDLRESSGERMERKGKEGK